MRELTSNEVQEVSGGFVFLIMAILAVDDWGEASYEDMMLCP